MKKFFLFLSLTFLSLTLFAQNANWQTSARGDYMYNVTEAGDYIWANDAFSMKRINKKTGVVDVELTEKNSNLPYLNRSVTVMPGIGKNATFFILGTLGFYQYDGQKVTFLDKAADGSAWAPFSIYTPVKDSKGNLWYDSSDGNITKYDGQTLSKFKPNNSTFGTIWDMAITKRDDIWVSTFSNGVFLYDGADWFSYTAANIGITNNIPSVDTLKFGKTVVYNSNSFAITESGFPTFTAYTAANLPFLTTGVSISKVSIDKDKKLWVATNNGLYYQDANNEWKKETVSILPNQNIFNLVIDGNDKWLIYSGTAFKKLSNNTLTNLFSIPQNALADEVFRFITFDKNGTRYLSFNTIRGVFKWDNTGIKPFQANIFGNKTNNLCAFDKINGDMWIGGTDSTLTKISGTSITQFDKQTTKITGILINKMLVDKGNLYFIVSGRGVGTFIGGQWDLIPFKTIDPTATSLNITDIILDKTGELMAATTRGLFRSNGGVWEKLNQTDVGTLPYAYSLAADKNGDIFVGSFIAHKFDGTNWKTYSDKDAPLNVVVRNSTYDENTNTMWFTTGGMGVYSYNITSDKWTNYSAKNSPLLSSNTLRIGVDKDGTKWFFSPGLNRYNEKGFVGTKDVSNLVNIEVYPNPTTDAIYFAKNAEMIYPIQASLFDTEGKLIKSFSLDNEGTRMSIQELTSGIYILSSKDKDGNIAINQIVKN